MGLLCKGCALHWHVDTVDAFTWSLSLHLLCSECYTGIHSLLVHHSFCSKEWQLFCVFEPSTFGKIFLLLGTSLLTSLQTISMALLCSKSRGNNLLFVCLCGSCLSSFILRKCFL